MVRLTQRLSDGTHKIKRGYYWMAVSQSKRSETGDFKALLRDIYYSVELKIGSPFANNSKAKLDELCTGKVPTEQSVTFQHCFSVMEIDVKAKKNAIKKEGREVSYKDMYLYQAEKVPNILAKFPPLLTGSLREPLLWQIINMLLRIVAKPIAFFR